MVPLRLVAEALGAAVAWDGEARRVDIAYGGQLLKLFVGVAAEGLDVPPYIKNDRTMVPLRYIMETFGADVSWNAADKSITPYSTVFIIIITSVATVSPEGRRATYAFG